MVKGIVHKNRPVIKLTIGWESKTQKIIVLVDTGFTGELKLSPKEILDLGIIPTHAESIELANGKRTKMFASLARVCIEGIENNVATLIGDGIPTIGVGLLKRFGYNLNIDFKNDLLVLQK